MCELWVMFIANCNPTSSWLFLFFWCHEDEIDKTCDISSNICTKTSNVKSSFDVTSSHTWEFPIQHNKISGRTHFHPKSISSNDTFNQHWFHPKKITCGTINMVRVCVKASPAEGWRHFHTNTAYVHFWGLSRSFCWTLAAEGLQCSAERPAEGPKVGV